MLEMVAHEAAAHGAKGFLNRGNLHHDVGAVPVALNHTSEASNLAFDAAQPFQISGFDTGIYGGGFARHN